TSGLGKQDVFLILVYAYVIIVSGFQAVGDAPFYIRISKSAGFYIKEKISSVLWDYFLLVLAIIPTFLMHQADVLWDVGLALSSGLFLFLVNQLIFSGAGNSRGAVIIVQTVSLIVFVAGYFVNYSFFVLLIFFLIILFTAFHRLKKDYVW
ncbi:MAG: hypothetical protein JXA91_04875, partial [Candidatus Thermoplasmatota archaeon]|nr:hypothetical protein [Candidatus Thermoplasmatota archaeon]